MTEENPLFFYFLWGGVAAVLVSVGFVLEVRPLLKESRPKPATPWAWRCLGAGAVGFWGAVATGFWGPSKSVLFREAVGRDSFFMSVWMAIVFTALFLGRLWAGRRGRAWVALVWGAALGVLGAHVLMGLKIKSF